MGTSHVTRVRFWDSMCCNPHDCGRALFIPERVNGVQERGLSSRVEAEGNPDQGREYERQQYRAEADERGPLREVGNQLRGEDAEDNADDTSQQRERDGLHQELGEDI